MKQKISQDHFLIWSAARSKPQNTTIQFVSLFQAVNSFFDVKPNVITRFAFTHIIPHPATEYNTIFTCMRNFQDVLLQRDLEYGPLWCDEGIYRIAKELQLLNPSLFSNIFLGIGRFHMEKILISCCGSYLKECGVENVFVESDVFASVVQLLMSEVDSDNIKHFQSILPNTSPNESHNWDLQENNMHKLVSQYETFTKDSGEEFTVCFLACFFEQCGISTYRFGPITERSGLGFASVSNASCYSFILLLQSH